jgi:hypothetical protein
MNKGYWNEDLGEFIIDVNSKLTHLDLSYNFVSPKDMTEICD